MGRQANPLRPAVVLWMSSNGEVACLAHGGAELRAAVGRYPDRSDHTTGEICWVGLTAGRLARAGSPGCETCEAAHAA